MQSDDIMQVTSGALA